VKKQYDENMLNDYVSELITCSCGIHIMKIEKFRDENQVYISFYETLSINRNNIFNRIKKAFKYLFTGRMEKADFVIDDEELEKVILSLKEANNLKVVSEDENDYSIIDKS
jgi:hypothetical protein